MTEAPDVIVISETKLNDFSFSYSLRGYKFVNNNSKTKAGGVEFYEYIKSIYSFNIRHDLSLNVNHCEDIWIEVTLKNNSTFVFGLFTDIPNMILLIF